jgi:hypothetical protein
VVCVIDGHAGLRKAVGLVARGRRPALCCPQASQPRAQGSQTRPGRDPRGLPPVASMTAPRRVRNGQPHPRVIRSSKGGRNLAECGKGSVRRQAA